MKTDANEIIGSCTIRYVDEAGKTQLQTRPIIRFSSGLIASDWFSCCIPAGAEVETESRLVLSPLARPRRSRPKASTPNPRSQPWPRKSPRSN